MRKLQNFVIGAFLIGLVGGVVMAGLLIHWLIIPTSFIVLTAWAWYLNERDRRKIRKQYRVKREVKL